jgi:hypothetical protein
VRAILAPRTLRRDGASDVVAHLPGIPAVLKNERRAARLRAHPLGRPPRFIDEDRAAVHLDEQRRPLGEPEGAEGVEGRDRPGVEKLERGDVDPVPDQVGDGTRRVRLGGEGEATLPARLWQSSERQRQLGRHRQRSLRADQQPDQVVTR